MHGITKKKKPYVTLRQQLAQRNDDIRTISARHVETVRALNDQVKSLRARLESDNKAHKMYLDHQKVLEKDYQMKVLDQQNMLQKEIDRLMTSFDEYRLENWQLKAALGYDVPGHIKSGNFHCMLCEAKSETLLEVQKRYDDALDRLEQCDTMKIKLEFATELLRR